MPSQVRCKENAERAEHHTAKYELGVREAGVTDWERYWVHRARNVPEHQESVDIPGSPYKEQPAGNSVEIRCFHRSSPEWHFPDYGHHTLCRYLYSQSIAQCQVEIYIGYTEPWPEIPG